MKLSSRFLMEFMRGLYHPWQVIAFVPGEFAIRIGARTSDLRIRRDYALKLRHKHRFAYQHFELIQKAINEGWVLTERGDLVFVLAADSPYFANFALVVKREAGGRELWLKTFHRIDRRKLERLLRDNEMLRMHLNSSSGFTVDE